jgi:hypothetical protein
MRRPDRTLTVHVFHHFPEGFPVKGKLTVTLAEPVPPAATRAVLTIQGVTMPGQITVDTTNETATIDFVDDKGDVVTAPAGTVVAFTSDNTAVVDVTNDPSNPFQGDVRVVAAGTANIGATITGVFEPDGVTPFTVASVLVTVSPGAAVGAELVLSV